MCRQTTPGYGTRRHWLTLLKQRGDSLQVAGRSVDSEAIVQRNHTNEVTSDYIWHVDDQKRHTEALLAVFPCVSLCRPPQLVWRRQFVGILVKQGCFQFLSTDLLHFGSNQGPWSPGEYGERSVQ